MAHLDKANLVCMGAQRFKEAVDAITRQSKNCIYTPANEALDNEISNRFCHDLYSLFLSQFGKYKRIIEQGSDTAADRDPSPPHRRSDSYPQSYESIDEEVKGPKLLRRRASVW